MSSLNKYKIGCVASFCNSLFNNQNNILFYNFPENPVICQKWIEFSEQPELKNLNVQTSKQYRLCSLHFNKKQYYNNTNSLQLEAIPTVKTIFKQNKTSDSSSPTGKKSYHIILIEDNTMNIPTEETDTRNSVKDVLKINSKPFKDAEDVNQDETNIKIKEKKLRKYNLRTRSDIFYGTKSNNRSITRCSISKNKNQDTSHIKLIKKDKANREIEKKNREILKINNSECSEKSKTNEFDEVPANKSYLNNNKIQSCFVLVTKLNIDIEGKNIENSKANYLNNDLKPSGDSTRKNKINKIRVNEDSVNENQNKPVIIPEENNKGNIKIRETDFENCKTNYLENSLKRSHKFPNKNKIQNQKGVILAEKNETNIKMVKNDNEKSFEKNNLNDNSNSPEEFRMKFNEILTTECLRNGNKHEHQTNLMLVKENYTNTKISEQNSDKNKNKISKNKIDDQLSIKSTKKRDETLVLNKKIDLLNEVLKELQTKSDNSNDSIIDMEEDELDSNSSNSNTSTTSFVSTDYDSIDSDLSDTESRTANDKTLNNQFDLVNYLETFNKPGRSATHTLINRLLKSQMYKCDICFKEFHIKKSYKSHMDQVHSDKPIFHCNKCTERVHTLKQLERHEELKHSDPRKYICSKCPKIFTKLSNLKRHEEIHNETIYRCSICSKEFLTRRSLQRHSTRHLSRKYSCQYCVKTFATITTVQTHEQLHKQEKPYLCDECPTQFKVIKQLIRHKKCHKPLKVQHEKFICDICSAVLKSKQSLCNHKLFHEDEKKYVCDICDRRFLRHDYLQNHLRTHTGKKRHECDRCDANFSKICDLENHRLNVHNVELLYRCKICLREFLTIYELRKHRVTHLLPIRYQLPRKRRKNLPKEKRPMENKLNKETPLECQICNCMYKSKLALMEHVRSHTDERPYECNVCFKKFYQLSEFAQHQQQHTDVRQYQCSMCPKAFKRKSFLIIHERIHTGEKPYKRRVSSRPFTQSGDCKKHEQKLHPHTIFSTVPTLDKINEDCTVDDVERNQSAEVLSMERDVQLESNASVPILFDADKSNNSNNNCNTYIEDDFQNIEFLDEDFKLYDIIHNIL